VRKLALPPSVIPQLFEAKSEAPEQSPKQHPSRAASAIGTDGPPMPIWSARRLRR